ncbi:catalase family protein [Variovorax sp. J22P240]|uniref:catalase family protein n=1 Tax=Variovorax sp. J22P240 TaxID=3053514 RepID=UPI002577DFAD|nr:catalase family protein [Variovorax sp. J22P240]MDL9997683.1 catalase family protein [Variovorax sp. J22P240]
MNSNASRPTPRANTGSVLRNFISDSGMAFIRLERRFDPFFRPAFDAFLRDPLARLTTAMINSRRSNEGLRIAEEKLMPDEDSFTDSIVKSFTRQMSDLWKPGGFERGGNTKTQGIVRGEFIVHDDIPEHMKRGIYAKHQTFPAWVRFSGPGPYITPDIDDVGFMSISIKLMGVPGPKLMDEEKHTLDMFAVSTPTFVTPDAKCNAALQIESVKNAQIFYFVNLRDPHFLDLIMQSLFIKTQSSPFEAPYFSCVPYLMGEGQAMQYSVWPTTTKRTPIPRLPMRPPDDYLRNTMVASLAEGDVELDIRLQMQTDPHLMPIENAGVLWPEKLSPRVSVATLRLPRQKFDSPAQMEFAKRLSFNPWHTVPEHRPLGNQSRARKRMYWELSQLRHNMNVVPHYEPTGDEVFE